MSSTLMDMAVDMMPERWSLSANDKNVLVQLARMADSETDDCYPGLPYIAMRTGLSESTCRRSIRDLKDGEWLSSTPQERSNGSTSSNLYVLNYRKVVACIQVQRDEEAAKKRAMLAGQSVAPAASPPCQGDTLPPVTVTPPPCQGDTPITNNNITNSLSDAQARDWEGFDKAVREAAGDAADEASPNIVSAFVLRVLLAERPNSPACTMDEIIDGVTRAAAWYRGRNLTGKMRNWDMAVRMACEARDLRIRGNPIKEPAKATPTASASDTSAWSMEQWWGAVKTAVNRAGGVWPSAWGPEPGAEGSAAPTEIVEFWKRKAA